MNGQNVEGKAYQDEHKLTYGPYISDENIIEVVKAKNYIHKDRNQ